MEDKIKRKFESLDLHRPKDTINQIPLIVESARQYSSRYEQEVRNSIYGVLAEQSALTLLKMYQTKYESGVYEGLIFEYEKNMTTEIDLILLTRNVAFIIECKHRSQDIDVLSDGSFSIGGRVESPINQNLGHIRKLFNSLEHGNLVPNHRIFNLVFILFNEAKMNNPITLFNKEGFDGAFVGIHNLLPLVRKIDSERSGGKIPINTIGKELIKKGEPFQGKKGMEKHLENLRNRRVR